MCIRDSDKIMNLIKPFLDKWDKIENVDTIIPVPPSNKNRSYQPSFEIAYAIAEYTGKSYVEDVLIKTSDEQSKNLDIGNKKDLIGSIVANKHAKQKNNVLLIDDLYSSGSTLEQCVKELKKDNNVDKIYALAMTKTRRWEYESFYSWPKSDNNNW